MHIMSDCGTAGEGLLCPFMAVYEDMGRSFVHDVRAWTVCANAVTRALHKLKLGTSTACARVSQWWCLAVCSDVIDFI